MAIKTVTLEVPDPEQPLEELTRDEKELTFKQLGAIVSRLDTRRRRIHRLLTAVEERQKARQLLSRLSPQVREALKVELGLRS